MNIKEYDLPDIELMMENVSPYRCMVWIPESVSVVLGQSNDVESSLYVQNILKDGIPVYKRPSGGESVVLSPRMLVISILKRGDNFRAPGLYFRAYSEKIISALDSLGIVNLRVDGISDICIGDRKVLGSSIYRNKDMVFYHGVLNVSEGTGMLEWYLKHPQREPEYRKGRIHSEFVTSLEEEGYHLDTEEIQRTISNVINGNK
jgi:lipoate-protein ligase A